MKVMKLESVFIEIMK